MHTFNTAATKYSKTAIKVASFDDVQQHIIGTLPEVRKFGPMQFDGMKHQFYGLYTEGGEPVGDCSVSQKYVPHTVADHICSLLEASRQAFGGELSVDSIWDGSHHRLVVMPTQDNLGSGDNGNGDKIFPRLSILGGFAGRAFEASLGFYRAICTNLAILQTVHTASMSIRHTPSFSDKISILVEQFANIRESWRETLETKNRMEKINVQTTEFFREFFGEKETKKGNTGLQNRIEKILARIHNEQAKLGQPVETFNVNGWLLFNAVQGAFQHDFTRKEKNPTLRGLATWNDSEVKKAEELILSV